MNGLELLTPSAHEGVTPRGGQELKRRVDSYRQNATGAASVFLVYSFDLL
jgi:hypothetical protein